MTNQELYQEMIKRDEKMIEEIHALKLELTLFKGRAFGFMAAVSLIFTMITNVGMFLLNKQGE